MKFFGATDVGRQRANNEDAWVVLGELGAAILADGMGGENCGEVGSAVTVETVAEYLRAPEAGLTTEEIAKEAIRAANARVLETARTRRECEGMGSTVVVALWRGAELVLANVGDSRAYLYRAGGLRQLTYDQNFANELRTRLGFSEDRLRQMPNRNVLTMAVGIFEEVLIRTHAEKLKPGDQILLCSDGLYGPVMDDNIAATLGQPEGLEQKVRKLIAMANQAGGPDNVTAILLEYGDENDG
jgi:serine/threonine protein phosphatase PrpC